MHKTVDLIIIGAGISGLYSAYLYKKQHPSKEVCIFEKSSYIGGRIRTKMFGGTKIVQGAGVGRFPKDKHLIRLLKELNIPFQTYPMTVQYSKQIQIHANKIHNWVKQLEKSIHLIKSPTSFKTYATSVLGKKEYENFVNVVGYTDFENTDALYAVKHYGFDDIYNHKENVKIFIDWDALLEKLIDFIGIENIHINSQVIALDPDNQCVTLSSEKKFYARDKCIVATPMPNASKLLKNYFLGDYVTGQPFAYVYAKLSTDSTLAQYVQSYSVVGPPLRKIIPFDHDKNVFMIAYVDNQDSKDIKQHWNDVSWLENQLQKIYPKAYIKIDSLWHIYWNVGTHYFLPFSPHLSIKELIMKLQCPHPCVRVVGEALSFHQGWVEGALESAKIIS